MAGTIQKSSSAKISRPNYTTGRFFTRTLPWRRTFAERRLSSHCTDNRQPRAVERGNSLLP